MKIDLHCHSYHSKDGISSPESLLVQAKKRGLDGIALTDHNNTKGWKRAQKKAEELKMLFIPGEEIKIRENGKFIGEILAYFIKEEINPEGKTGEEIIKEIHNQGGIAIIAHPYHWKKPFKELEKYKNIVDGVEVFNSRSQSKKGNEMSLFFAEKNKLPITAGSDCHTKWEIGNAYIETNTNNLKEDILNKKIKIAGKQSLFFIQLLSPISKIIYWLKTL